MRLVHYTHVGSADSRVSFRASVSRAVSLPLTAVGAGLLAFIPVAGASGMFPPLFPVVLAFPGFGLFLTGGLLLFHGSETDILLEERRVDFTERLGCLPVRRLTWSLDDFDGLHPVLAGCGREGKHNHYTVLTLKGRCDLPLLAMDDRQEAVALCEELRAVFGFA